MTHDLSDADRSPSRPPAAAASCPPAGALGPQHLASLRQRFEADPHARLLQNAAVRTRIEDVALSRDRSTALDHSFSHVLDDWSATNQKQSGRCWMFAGLNLLRVGAMRKMNLASFEFSQTHTQFWDKLERANYFLEAILETSDRPIDDRTVAWLLDHPLDDGGQWDMFVALIRKHGLVPQAVMPETASSSCTRTMNAHLLAIVRQGAAAVREAQERGVGAQRQAKHDCLATVHRVLCLHLGTPPTEFDWQWTDKDKRFHRGGVNGRSDGRYTPQQFAEAFVTLPLDELVCLVHDPRPTSPIGRCFTVQYLGNVVGAPIVRYLNVPIEVIRDAALQTILAGEPVWFGCDVGKMMHRDLGLWHEKLYDLEGLYATRLTMSKADRLVHHETKMTHAMLFTGVDVVERDGRARPRRWRVENSWGEEVGRKGFFAMDDSWFDQHLFEIAVRKRHVPRELLRALDDPPIVLPPWDPMGALASPHA